MSKIKDLRGYLLGLIAASLVFMIAPPVANNFFEANIPPELVNTYVGVGSIILLLTSLTLIYLATSEE